MLRQTTTVQAFFYFHIGLAMNNQRHAALRKNKVPLQVWGRKTSSNVQALMWCIGELALAYERYDVGHKFGGTDTPAFLAMNPNGTVPVMRDADGDPIWETGAIVRYLAGCYGDEDFWPADCAGRAQIDQWAEWAKLNIALNFTGPVFGKLVRTAKSQQDRPAIDAALSDLHRKMAIAEARLSRNAFVAGDAFSMADIQFGHVLYRYFDIDIVRPSLPAIKAYYEKLKCRPAYVEHVMVSYEELRVP